MPHSPAPWHTDPRFPNHILAGPITIDSEGNPQAKSICKIQGNRLSDAPHNQALIIAAPVLLAALQSIHSAAKTSNRALLSAIQDSLPIIAAATQPPA